MARRVLQVLVAILGVLPLITGALSLALGPRELPEPGAYSAMLDSNYRFYAAFWVGAGLLWLREVPRIEQASPLFRFIGALFVLGGLGRALAIVQSGSPGGGLLAALAVELVLVPILLLWQAAIAHSVS